MLKKDLLGLKELSADEITAILVTAKKYKAQLLARGKSAELAGKTVTTLFYENSTRTRVSFENAAKHLSAYTSGITAAASSVQKGESLIDTGKTLESLMSDVIVIRTPMCGAPHFLAQNVRASVINAGDGTNEHPTQALLDMLTIYEQFGSFKGLKIVIAGDAKHSRVVRSNLWGLNKLGASVTVVAPKTLLPAAIERMGCETSNNLDEAVVGADVVMGLRLQLERQQAGLFPSGTEYHRFYGITERHMAAAQGHAMLLHPGPINRELELSGGAADGESSRILTQVTNGIAVRMAVLSMLTN